MAYPTLYSSNWFIFLLWFHVAFSSTISTKIAKVGGEGESQI